MTQLARALGGPKFRLWLYSLTLLFAATTLSLAAAFQDMYDWNTHNYPQAAAVILAGASLLFLTIPVLHFYLHRKRPTSRFSSRAIEISALSPSGSVLIAGAIMTCVLQHKLYETDPFVPDLGIALEVLAWVTVVCVYLLMVTAYLRPEKPNAEHARLADGRSGSEMV
ncbi:hypothetical protein JCM11491_000107 [Sporobolomyces phaffii]